MGKLRIISFCLLVVYVFSFWSTVYADNVKTENEDYNFSIYFHNVGGHKKGQPWYHDYDLFFDLDHNIAVYYHEARQHYGSDEINEFCTFKMEEDADGFYHLYDVYGGEYEWLFTIKSKGLLFGAFKFKEVKAFDHEGKRSSFWSYADSLEHQPVYSLRVAGFYKKYPTPADVYSDFSFTHRLESKNEMVWVSAVGRCWHTNPQCRQIRHGSQTTIEKAEELGKVPCSLCS